MLLGMLQALISITRTSAPSYATNPGQAFEEGSELLFKLLLGEIKY